MKKEPLPLGFICKCGKRHEYPAYVYAHWDEKLTHTCDKCKSQSVIVRSVATAGRKKLELFYEKADKTWL